ncbi:hypothetical protein SAMD00019534_081670 [Acytostelium subglobosum LB1]|uniref:hypothetical protein n=1 Tax=Acytostelium subglobosum LB1 TaxID=1410327 RepID=UPI0006450666|nr:hypothetical protein SAMD00019534_081670 [Acytostelium subglobosum LB1]GAM24992.1 hypothetical protein SAMD00019534_081670 [Acytostelium subglobosum LB1]|eukprot:XP_012752081.1 hypothetical protein SAMD00019534_081670 [Acytostelium subglobosum LB1]
MLAIKESRDHLLPWMPWAKDDQHLDNEEMKQMLISMFSEQFHSGLDYPYGIFLRPPQLTDGQQQHQEVFVGSTGLHPRIEPKNEAMEIGYWMHVDHLNRGLCTEAVRALVCVGFDHLRLKTLEIHSERNNQLSQRIPKRLGFQPSAHPSEHDVIVWTLHREDYIKMLEHHHDQSQNDNQWNNTLATLEIFDDDGTRVYPC